jgi:hypothetical protein
VPSRIPAVGPGPVLLMVTIGLFTVYVIGVGGTTATAIRVTESWRRRNGADTDLAPGAGDVVLTAPTLPRAFSRLRTAGWLAFVPCLALAVFAVRDYPWVTPVVVLLMVALNAFYFTAMQNMGEQLTLTPDGFRIGSGRSARFVRWLYVTQLTGARVGAFTGMKMPEEDEWQDPRVRANVILYRLNRALTPSRRPLLHRLIGFTYYDGVIRNAFGVPTATLLRSMREWQKRALEAEKLPL